MDDATQDKLREARHAESKARRRWLRASKKLSRVEDVMLGLDPEDEQYEGLKRRADEQAEKVDARYVEYVEAQDAANAARIKAGTLD